MSIPFDGSSNEINAPVPVGNPVSFSKWIHPPETWESLMRKPVRVWDHALSNEEIIKIWRESNGSLSMEETNPPEFL